jgi:hypothetical protein
MRRQRTAEVIAMSAAGGDSAGYRPSRAAGAILQRMIRRFRRAKARPEEEVLATYYFKYGTARLVRYPSGRLEWLCDCASFREPRSRTASGWCKHVAKAEARRSIERIITMRASHRADTTREPHSH